MNDNLIPLKDHRTLFDDFVKQIGAHSTLLAGFAFAVLAFVSYDPSTRPLVTTAFVVCAAITILLEILASFILNILSFAMKAGFSIDPFDTFRWQLKCAWYSYLLGLYSFLLSLLLLAWIKYRPVAVIITVLVSIVTILGIVIVISITVANNRIVRKVLSELNSPR